MPDAAITIIIQGKKTIFLNSITTRIHTFTANVKLFDEDVIPDEDFAAYVSNIKDWQQIVAMFNLPTEVSLFKEVIENPSS